MTKHDETPFDRAVAVQQILGFWSPPDWRWHAAEAMNEPSDRSRRSATTDRWILRALAWLQDPAAVRSVGGVSARDIEAALALSRAPQPDRRNEFEARLLAGQSMTAIARIMKLPVRTVRTYEALFYAVRDRMGMRDWIAYHCLGRESKTEFLGHVWKTLAFSGGPLALDQVIAVSCHSRQPGWPFRLPEALEKSETALERKVRLTIALLVLPANTPLRQIFELQRAVRACEHFTHSASVAAQRPANSLPPNATVQETNHGKQPDAKKVSAA